jgi:hypothetical protein
MASSDFEGPTFAGAGSRRFRSRSFMNSSNFADPGRGGASAGNPPAHSGIASLTPAANFSLMVPHPPNVEVASISANGMARRRPGFGLMRTLIALLAC